VLNSDLVFYLPPEINRNALAQLFVVMVTFSSESDFRWKCWKKYAL